MSELLVVDKSIFHSLCDCDEKLCAFVKDYNIVLPHALFRECLISENQTSDKDPVKLVRQFDGAIKAGAKMGYSSQALFQAEKMTLCPVKSVIDGISTQKFRDGTANTDIDFIKQEAECCRNTSPPSGCVEDFHFQAAEHARRTKKRRSRMTSPFLLFCISHIFSQRSSSSQPADKAHANAA